MSHTAAAVRTALLCACLFVCGADVYSQTLNIKNVSFREKNSTIFVSYDLQGTPGQKYLISLHLSYDFGETFTMKPAALAGDAGKGILPGPQKTIVWDYKKDYPEGLSGDGFVFEVRAESYARAAWLPYMLGGTIAAGVLYHWYTASRGNGAEKKGSLTITVPAEL